MAPPAELAPGPVTTPGHDAELVVPLSGEFDLARRRELDGLARRLARRDGPVVVDLTDVTFCDGTLAGFLAEAVGNGSATVRASTRLTREFLVVYGLSS